MQVDEVAFKEFILGPEKWELEDEFSFWDGICSAPMFDFKKLIVCLYICMYVNI